MAINSISPPGAFLELYKSQVSENDAEADYLENKIVEGNGISVTKNSDGGVESLQIDIKNDVIITPEDYGAVGDGVHDDTEALQAAIDAAAGKNWTILLGIKPYLITSPLTTRTGRFKLVGQGWGTYTSAQYQTGSSQTNLDAYASGNMSGSVIYCKNCTGFVNNELAPLHQTIYTVFKDFAVVGLDCTGNLTQNAVAGNNYAYINYTTNFPDPAEVGEYWITIGLQTIDWSTVIGTGLGGEAIKVTAIDYDTGRFTFDTNLRNSYSNSITYAKNSVFPYCGFDLGYPPTAHYANGNNYYDNVGVFHFDIGIRECVQYRALYFNCMVRDCINGIQGGVECAYDSFAEVTSAGVTQIKAAHVSRFPDPAAIGSYRMILGNHSVGYREDVTVTAINYSTGYITLSAPTTYAYETWMWMCTTANDLNGALNRGEDSSQPIDFVHLDVQANYRSFALYTQGHPWGITGCIAQGQTHFLYVKPNATPTGSPLVAGMYLRDVYLETANGTPTILYFDDSGAVPGLISGMGPITIENVTANVSNSDTFYFGDNHTEWNLIEWIKFKNVYAIMAEITVPKWVRSFEADSCRFATLTSNAPTTRIFATGSSDGYLPRDPTTAGEAEFYGRRLKNTLPFQIPLDLGYVEDQQLTYRDGKTLKGRDSYEAINKIFYPEDYGAVGDGTHDDAEAIQDAVDAASQVQGVVQLSKKRYLLKSPIVNLYGNYTMRGAGWGTTIMSRFGLSEWNTYTTSPPDQTHLGFGGSVLYFENCHGFTRAVGLAQNTFTNNISLEDFCMISKYVEDPYFDIIEMERTGTGPTGNRFRVRYTDTDHWQDGVTLTNFLYDPRTYTFFNSESAVHDVVHEGVASPTYTDIYCDGVEFRNGLTGSEVCPKIVCTGTAATLLTSTQVSDASTLSISTADGREITLTISSAWNAVPAVGHILYIPTSSPFTYVNEGRYVVTAATSNTITAYKIENADSTVTGLYTSVSAGPFDIAATTDAQIVVHTGGFVIKVLEAWTNSLRCLHEPNYTPATGETGVNATSQIRMKNVGIMNWPVGIDLSVIYGSKFDECYIYGCFEGVRNGCPDVHGWSGHPSLFSDTHIQSCWRAVALYSSGLFSWQNGLAQGNRDILYINPTTSKAHLTVIGSGVGFITLRNIYNEGLSGGANPPHGNGWDHCKVLRYDNYGSVLGSWPDVEARSFQGVTLDAISNNVDEPSVFDFGEPTSNGYLASTGLVISSFWNGGGTVTIPQTISASIRDSVFFNVDVSDAGSCDVRNTSVNAACVGSAYQNDNYLNKWLSVDQGRKTFGGSMPSSTGVPCKGYTGTVTISGTDLYGTVTIAPNDQSKWEDDADFDVVMSAVSHTGTPPTGAYVCTGISDKTTHPQVPTLYYQFRVNLAEAPGTGNSVTFRWILVR